MTVCKSFVFRIVNWIYDYLQIIIIENWERYELSSPSSYRLNSTNTVHLQAWKEKKKKTISALNNPARVDML